VGLGCDYITAVAPDSNDFNSLHGWSTGLFRSEAESGNQPRAWGMSGFKGWKCGSVEIGVREKDVLVRLSSEVAARSWKRCAELAQTISRLDLQATVQVLNGPTQEINKHRRAAARHAKKLNDKPIVRWTADNRGGYTLYLGARQSICFGRIYDKYAQSKMDHYRSCVRFEVQMHNEMALRTATLLCSLAHPRDMMAARINQFFARRDVKVDLPTELVSDFALHRSRSDVEKNLEWLSKSVRPTVERLLSLGHGRDVLSSLGLIVHEPVSD
jgi:DNA relaxase NicK